MRGRCRVNDKAPRVADIGEMTEQLDIAHERDAGIVAAFQPESEYSTRALGRIALGEDMKFIAGQACVIDPRHLVVTRKPGGDGERVVAMTQHAEWQGLDPGQDEKGVEGRDRGTEIAQTKHAASDGEGEIAEGFGKRDAVIGDAWLRQRGIAPALEPIERAAIDDGAADRV